MYIAGSNLEPLLWVYERWCVYTSIVWYGKQGSRGMQYKPAIYFVGFITVIGGFKTIMDHRESLGAWPNLCDICKLSPTSDYYILQGYEYDTVVHLKLTVKLLPIGDVGFSFVVL